MTNLTNKIKFVNALRTNTGSTDLSYIHIDITSKCNLHCIMCNWRYQVKPVDMSFDLFKKIIQDCLKLGLKKVVFAATGESLLHPDFPSMINYLKEYNLSIELVTNLSFLNDNLLSTLLKLDKITVSIDGATKETYEKIRIGANFYRTLSNLKELSVNKTSDLFLDINYVINKENYFEVKDFSYLVGPFVDAINYKFIHISTPETSKLKLSDEEIKSTYELLNNIYTPSRIKINIGKPSKPYIHNMPCYNLWFGCYISPSGLVFPCCNFYEEKDSLGNLKTQSMKEIWNSDKYNTLRKKFKGHKPTLCEYCPGDNQRIHNMILKIPFSRRFIY